MCFSSSSCSIDSCVSGTESGRSIGGSQPGTGEGNATETSGPGTVPAGPTAGTGSDTTERDMRESPVDEREEVTREKARN